ncbi:uncharacterized protein [Apostichopus japonicus]|uniref:uncharacterized protein n=1 Tax=Stichopus japonicus TaxID=307972 RepID=UPI003AB3BB50
MAASKATERTDMIFFNCAVCLNELKEPKLLPCLHRFCRDCLIKLDQTLRQWSITCPVCQYKCRIPNSGVNGLQDDLQTKYMLHVKELRCALEREPFKVCTCCSLRTSLSAYCFQCEDYLCDKCFQYHLQKKKFKTHKQQTINLMEKRVTPTKLAHAKELLACLAHPTQPAQFCCSTCDNTPVCDGCKCGLHRRHDTVNVTDLAKSIRFQLEERFAELSRHESKLFELPQKIETIRKTLRDNVARKKVSLKSQYEKQANKIQANIETQQSQMQQKITEIEKRRKTECSQVRLETEKKMQKLLEECEGIIEEKKKKFSDQIEQIKQNHVTEKRTMIQKFENIKDNMKHLTLTVENQMKKNEKDLQQTLALVEKTLQRYVNFTETASYILASKDDWSDIRYLPDVVTSSNYLIKDTQYDFPEMESLSDLFIGDIIDYDDHDKLKVMNENFTVVDIDDIKTQGFWVDDVTRSEDGRIVITGCATHEYSHISVINAKGQIVRQDRIRRPKKVPSFPNRFCSFFSKLQIATACIPDEVGLYNIRDGSYKKKIISDCVDSWCVGRSVYCVTTDPTNNHIIVGTNSRDVYVFDDQLNYSHTITLPDTGYICYPRDIAVYSGALIICDYGGQKAYTVATEESKGTVIHEFPKPGKAEDELQPLSVCTDVNNAVYIIWVKSFRGQLTRVLSQYSQDGVELLTSIRLEDDSRCVATFNVGKSEKLAVATLMSGQLQIIEREDAIYESC